MLAKPIKYSLAVPGSKSLMNRALVCAALASGKSVLTNPVYCDDTLYMIKALRALGIKIITTKSAVTVHGSLLRFQSSQRPQRLFVGNAGTVMRFLTPLLPPGITLIGNARMQQRPMDDLRDAVAQLRTQRHITIAGGVSSQFISALLLAAPVLPHSITITVRGKTVSEPYIAMTVAVMKQFGVRVSQRGTRFTIRPQRYRSTQYAIEGDASSATYWWALAAITQSHITVTNIPASSTQPDLAILPILKKMGCTIKNHTVIGSWDYLAGTTVNMRDCPDAVPAVAVVAATANGKTTITGIAHLAGKESNRLQVIANNLKKLGVNAKAQTDRIIIHGVGTTLGLSLHLPVRTVKTHHDHRIAMAFSLLGVSVDDRQCVKKSYPNFWADYKTIIKHSQQQTIVLTGMRGAGKTTLGKTLAKRYGAKFIDTDRAIVALQPGSDSVADIVKYYGWEYFRAQETEVIRAVGRINNAVVAAGGGALIAGTNYAMVKNHYIILLATPVAELRRRLRAQPNQSQRPALTKRTMLQELNSVWQQRRNRYYAAADQIIHFH